MPDFIAVCLRDVFRFTQHSLMYSTIFIASSVN
nr:MAG TPA: Protein of unknown function (DUF3938) [Bacteriophage sp.]